MHIVARKDALLIWAIRQEVELTARAFAERSGLHERTIARALAGYGISQATADALLAMTGLSVRDLLVIRLGPDLPPLSLAEEEADAC